MAHHGIGRDAGGLGKAVIADVGRNHFQLFDDIAIADIVQRLGADPGLDVGLDHGQHLGCKPTGDAQRHQVLLALEGYTAAHDATRSAAAISSNWTPRTTPWLFSALSSN